MSRGKRSSSSAVLLLLCTVLVLSGATNKTEKNSSTCALQCDVPHGKTETTCTLMADPLKLKCSREVYSSILRNVSSLDLSDNKLTKIPNWMFCFCESLTELSLSRNKIKEIKPNTFKYLVNLKILNLSFNNLSEWNVDPNNELQSLNYLDVTGNEHWLPIKQLLQLKNLTTVRGLKLSEYCESCSLVKIETTAAEVNSRYNRLSSPSRWWWHDEVQYGKAFELIKVGFLPTCICGDGPCFTHQFQLPFFRAISDVGIKALSSLYATGSVAILVNITVVLVIAFHKSLRDDLAVWLILNVAVCDVLIGLFSVLYVKFHSFVMYIGALYDTLEGNNYDDKFMKLTNNIMGSILTCAVASQVCGSFTLTLEKFLKIVFAMRPNIRIGKRGVILFLSVFWSLSVLFAILPVFNVGHITYYNNFIGRTPFPTDELHWSEKKRVGIAAVTQIVLLIIQLTSFILYLPIFIVAKSSGASVGIKREATIARKIALLVFTNLIFFTVPVVLSIFQHNILLNVLDNWQEQTLTEFRWVIFSFNIIPVLCMNINSVLNPFLYAFRHPKIKQQLDTTFSRCRAVLSECFVALGQHLPCHSNRVQQENDTEMQEVA